jgi:hypothetical protein
MLTVNSTIPAPFILPQVVLVSITTFHQLMMPSGDLVTTYRKMHLFDIDIPGKITFKVLELCLFSEKDTNVICLSRKAKLYLGEML